MSILSGFLSLAFLEKKPTYPLHRDIKLIEALTEFEDGNYAFKLQNVHLSMNY